MGFWTLGHEVLLSPLLELLRLDVDLRFSVDMVPSPTRAPFATQSGLPFTPSC